MVKEVSKTPLYDAVCAYANSAPVRLHMPGHKGLFSGFESAWDLTELEGTDDLFSPSGAIKDAMEKAARSFGAAYSHFLTAGATSGILALLLSLSGKKVVVGRDCHRSVAAGCRLGGLTPLFVWPRLRDDGMPGMAAVSDIHEVLSRNPDTAAVIVTSPNYYGNCANLAALSCVVRDAGVLLIVDAAHGTHFAAGGPLPPYAGRFADAWVDGAHKTLPVLGQGAFLHLSERAKSYGLSPGRVVSELSAVHTSSPSYPIMVSLDLARARLFSMPQEWHELACEAMALRNRLENMGFTCPKPAAGDGIVYTDPTRIVTDVSGFKLTGYEVARLLISRGISVEMADEARIVALLAPWDRNALLEFERAMGELVLEYSSSYRGVTPNPSPLKPPSPAFAGYGADRESVSLKDSCGRISSALFGCYPPGIPLVWPGERIDEDVLTYLNRALTLGAKTFGVNDGNVYVYIA